METLTQTERNENIYVLEEEEEEDDDTTFVEICETYRELPLKHLKLINEHLELQKRYDEVIKKIDALIESHERVAIRNEFLQKENEKLLNKLIIKTLDENRLTVFKDEECVICLKNKPNILYCVCGHLCICDECEEEIENSKCPKCRTENSIKRKIF